MFGDQFYPTPPELATECILPYMDKYAHSRNAKILDPSAGSGAFLDAYLDLVAKSAQESNNRHYERVEEYRKEHGKYPQWWSSTSVSDCVRSARQACFAIEIDGNLQSVLLGKEYTLIDSNFLQHESKNHYSLVVMNPPFRLGARHLLHAWDTISFESLVCILNAETIRNTCTEERKRLKSIIDNNGFTVEFKESAFSTAERKTNVEIAIVRMSKEVKTNIFDPKDIERLCATTLNEEEIPDINALAKPDVIGNLVSQYNQTLEEYVAFRQAARKMAQFESLWDWDRDKTRREPKASSIDSKHTTDKEEYQRFVENLTQAAWNTLFRLTDIKGRMTSKVQKQFEQSRDKVGSMAFNESNAYTIIELLMSQTNQMLTDCVLEVFDYFTRYHENIVHYEGWKTNDAFEVGKKVILPNVMTRDYGKIDISYSYREQTEDIDKVMCFLSGRKYSKVKTISKAVAQHSIDYLDMTSNYSDIFESEFFRCKVFKKGTIHLTFKDMDLLRRFNHLPAKERGWLKAWQGKHGKKGDLVAV